MAKKIKVTENTVITKDDKGELSLVGKAKEALTSFNKMKIQVTILLHELKKEEVEKFLKDNNVPYSDIIDKKEAADSDTKFDLCVVGGHDIVTLHSDWRWAAEEVVQRLYSKPSVDKIKSEQEVMDKQLADIKKWTSERNKHKAEASIIS